MATTDEKTYCPFCKEEVKADAVKCKHCKSMLVKTKVSDCGCAGPDLNDPDLRSLMLRRAVGGQPGTVGVNDALCEWDCLWEWVECRKTHSRQYCDTREFFCNLFCKAGLFRVMR